jgi:hypothetical protein
LSEHLESTKPEVRAAARKTLQLWQNDADLGGVRSPDALAKLPEAERDEWRKLWAEVEALLGKAPN